ncbi:hypothetical protein NU09_2674 [Flavobacterium beibuense]|uniref:Uncharacterized protein n=2 Tax=Flavobacterium beibuense TaxID=657326 RepID=A0A444W794_9FLAO|nr:hypothetical protein NU09_2674 [Flavobacterium beibuense]
MFCLETYFSCYLYLEVYKLYYMFKGLKNIFFPKRKRKYKCPECGQYHQDWPALYYDAPINYSQLPVEDKERIASLDRDFCVIEYPDQTDRFIRVVLIQRVYDGCEDLHYGLWVSLSEKSFLDYKSHFDSNDYEAVYFGWISNILEGYDDTLSVPVDVVYNGGSNRPEIIPHKSYSHPFVEDYYNGIAKKEAQKRVNNILQRFNDNI